MPPTAPGAAQLPSKQQLTAINDYLAKKPDFEKLLEASDSNPQQDKFSREQSEYAKYLTAAVLNVVQERYKPDTKPNKSGEWVATMPELPGKPSDSGSNNKDTKADDPNKKETIATVKDHQANLGPVVAENLGQPASKEELKKRAEELNK